jgi:hypothetical protein
MIIANNNPNATVMSIGQFLTRKSYGAACKTGSVSSYSHDLSLELPPNPRARSDRSLTFIRTMPYGYNS